MATHWDLVNGVTSVLDLHPIIKAEITHMEKHECLPKHHFQLGLNERRRLAPSTVNRSGAPPAQSGHGGPPPPSGYYA